MTTWWEKQESTGDCQPTLSVFLERNVLAKGDTVVFDESQVPDEADREWDEEDDFWRARVTGKQGQTNALVWLHDDQPYSFTGAAKELLQQLTGRDKDKALSGYEYWTHPEFRYERLYSLRERDVIETDRT